MGLAAHAIEQAGIATACLSWIPDLTAAAGAPRTLGIDRPGNRPCGEPGDAEGQAAVVRAALEAAAAMEAPGRTDLPFRWRGKRSEVRTHPRTPPPIATLILRRPWLLPRLLRRDIPEG